MSHSDKSKTENALAGENLKTAEILKLVEDGAWLDLQNIAQAQLEKETATAGFWFGLLNGAAHNFMTNLQVKLDDQQRKFNFAETIAKNNSLNGPFDLENDPDKLSMLSAMCWGFPNEERLKETIRLINNYSMLPYQGLMSDAMFTSHCDEMGIDGCIVETGCWRGGSAAMMAAANMISGQKLREMFLFDSFEGLPFPDRSKDAPLEKAWFRGGVLPEMEGRDGELSPSNALQGATVEDVRHIVNEVIGFPAELTHVMPGWFQDTVPGFAAEGRPIAILRLDGDLYHSTMVPLRELYPLVVSGGFIVVDDWGYPGPTQAVQEYFTEMDLKLFPHKIGRDARYFIKP